MTTTTLTCIFCGIEYPMGTPPHGDQVLIDHIRVCEKHPLRACEADRTLLRAALVGLVGVDGAKDLDGMELILRSTPAPAEDKAASINAIHALRATLPPVPPAAS